MTVTLHERCERIELLLMDVDGVLTDGRIIYGDDGSEYKAFHVRDGTGLKLWIGAGRRAGIITGRRSTVVQRRAAELGLTTVIQGVVDKRAAFEPLLVELAKTAEQVCFIGDDLQDVPLLRRSGLGVAVADACAEAREDAHYVTRAAGGRGAVREIVELLLRAQGLWQGAVARYRD